MEPIRPESIPLLFPQLARLYFAKSYPSFEKLGIHPGQVPLLFALHEQNGLCQKELTSRMCVKASTVAVMIRRLERNGLVERRPDEKDQRMTRIYITGKGNNLYGALRTAAQEVEAEFYAGLSQEEILQLHGFFLRLRANLLRSGDNNPHSYQREEQPF